MIKVLIHKDTDEYLASGFVMYHEAKGIVYGNKKVRSIIRVCEGINMDVQIPLLIIDRKMFRVMSAHYRTCGVTRLRVIDLLSTRPDRSMREFHRNGFGKIEIVSEENRKAVSEFGIGSGMF